MNSRERVMAAIMNQGPDHVPCFGANSTVTYDQMKAVNAFWPEGHGMAHIMAMQAMAAHTIVGFDAVRVPFCQTMEAEAFGCKIKPGGSGGIPGIDHPPPFQLNDTPRFPADFLSRGRIPELIKAVGIIKKKLGDGVALIGGITGPLSLSAALLDTVPLLKASARTPEKIRPFLEVAEKAGRTLARALVDAGADVIACEDMTASPALVAPDTYRDYVLEYQAGLFEAIPVPGILHICGKVDRIVGWMGRTGAEILSIETRTDIHLAREKCGPKIILMGDVDTSDTLFAGDAGSVKEACEAAIEKGIQILAPGCAVAPGTPLKNLLAMVEVARAHKPRQH